MIETQKDTNSVLKNLCSLVIRCVDNRAFCHRRGETKHFPLKEINSPYRVEAELTFLGGIKGLLDPEFDLYNPEYMLSSIRKTVAAKGITHIIIIGHVGCLMYEHEIGSLSKKEQEAHHREQLVMAKEIIADALPGFLRDHIMLLYLNESHNHVPVDCDTERVHPEVSILYKEKKEEKKRASHVASANLVPDGPWY